MSDNKDSGKLIKSTLLRNWRLNPNESKAYNYTRIARSLTAENSPLEKLCSIGLTVTREMGWECE